MSHSNFGLPIERPAALPRSRLCCLFSAAFLFWVNMAAQSPVFPRYMQAIGANPGEVGAIIGAFAIGLIASRPQLGQLADSHSHLRVLRIGAIVATVAPLLYTMTTALPHIFAIRAFHGISIAAFTTGYLSLIASIAPAHRRGEVLSYSQST